MTEYVYLKFDLGLINELLEILPPKLEIIAMPGNDLEINNQASPSLPPLIVTHEMSTQNYHKKIMEPKHLSIIWNHFSNLW